MSLRHSSVRFVLLALLAALFMMVLAVGPAAAATTDGLRWEVGCEGFTNIGGGLLLNRDNTGEGREAFTISARDGLGSIIFAPFTDSAEVGTGVYLTPGTSFNWTTTPAANPLTVTVTSNAGNGQAAELVYTVTGTCERLNTPPTPVPPASRPPTETDLVQLGITSPSVPLNAPIPTARNTRDLRGLYPGILIVDVVNANLRSGAGAQYTIVGQVEATTQLIVLGRNETRTWWYVQAGDIIGWINGALVVISGDLTGVPVVASQGEIFPPRLFLYRTNTIRLSPNPNSLVLCSVPGNQEYFINGQNRDGSWLRIAAVCNDRMVNGWLRESTGAIRNSGDLNIPVLRR